MRTFLRWWETLGRPERIVAMSLAAGSVVAIANSATWAVAVCYMTHQKAQAAIWRATRLPAAPEEAGDETGAGEPGETDVEAQPAHGHHSDVVLPLA